ncbi:50S ribosomal protein L19, chloroplastic [Apostasia shenzhenica]|uniref:50S ribosomal protein L19, chloroplastic n=1 Tax=Apostasia shenzhenica TaxID=1088818 RepID=A0A2I0ATP2_9ASPA|nr:50S ribosomal protein L19, chloroplastic [Apostasia shenzhenica]
MVHLAASSCSKISAFPSVSSLSLASSVTCRCIPAHCVSLDAFQRAFPSPRNRRSRVFTAVGASSSDAAAAESDADQEEEALDESDGPADDPDDADVVAEDNNPAEEKPPRKPRIKLGEIMGILNKRAIEASEKQRPVPDIRTGDIVEIKLEVPENRKRLSVYKGIVMSKQNAGIHTTIRIRRIIAGVGVEIVFPIYSPNIKEIKVVNHRKVRRARLYYLRDKLPRFSTFK